MDKVINTVKFQLKGLRQNLILYILNFVLFPVLIALFYGILYSGEYGEDFKPLKINIVDNADTEFSQGFKKIIEGTKEGFEIVDQGYDYSIEIPKDYDEGGEIKIIGGEDSSNFTGVFLANIVSEISDSSKSSILMSEEIAKRSGDKEFLERFNNITQELGKTAIQMEYIKEADTEKQIAEGFAIDALALVAIMYLLNIPQTIKLANETGLNKRMASVPLKTIEDFFSSWISPAILIFIMMTIYVIIMRIIGKGFLSHFPQVILILFISSLFYGLIALFIAEFPLRKFITVILWILYLIQVFITNVVNTGILYEIKKYSFGSFISKPLKALSEHGNFSGAMDIFFVMIIISIVLIILNFLMIRKRGGRI